MVQFLLKLMFHEDLLQTFDYMLQIKHEVIWEEKHWNSNLTCTTVAASAPKFSFFFFFFFFWGKGGEQEKIGVGEKSFKNVQLACKEIAISMLKSLT